MDQLPATWTALCLLAFVLGARHGFDADHLATIDGLTRCNSRSNPRLARAAGALFSFGHGTVVMLVALAAGMLSAGWQTPAWLEITGVTVSILFLFGLAFINLRAVLVADADTVVSTTGFKAKLLGRFLTVQRSWAVAAVGRAFRTVVRHHFAGSAVRARGYPVRRCDSTPCWSLRCLCSGCYSLMGSTASGSAG